MKKIFTLLCAATISFYAFSQNQDCNLTFYTTNGKTFKITLNGVVKNAVPKNNVKITGLTLPVYSLNIHFTDPTIPDINKKTYTKPGYAISILIKPNRKGKYITRLQGATAMAGATATMESTPVYSTPPPTNSTTIVTSSPANVTTTQTTTTQTVNPNGNVNMNVSNPAGVSVNVNLGVPTATSSVSYSQTTTTTTSSTPTYTQVQSEPAGYVRCSHPMTFSEFNSAYHSIKSKSFDETKLKIAKQIISSNCMSSEQVKKIMLLFSFESTRLDLAKYAYGQTYDPQNYYKLNDAFTYSSSIDELNSYIKGFQK